jgi:ATP-binding cassette subfamily B protein
MRLNDKTKDFLIFSFDILRHRKGITALNIFCNAVIFSYSAATAYCVRQILNAIENAQGLSFHISIPYLAGILAGAPLVRIAAIMGCSCLDALRAYHYQNRIRVNVLRLLLNKDDVTGVAGKSASLYEVLNHDIPISTFPAELLTEVSGYFIYTLIALTMLLSINWQLTLFIFIPLSVAIFGVQRFSRRMKEKRQANRTAQDLASGFAGDVINTVLAIKASGAEGPVLNRYDRVNQNRRTAVLFDVKFNAKTGVLLNTAVHLGTAVMMFAAARLMTGGKFGIGDFSLFAAHLGTLADCVNRIVELIAESKRAEVSYERILSIAGDNNERALNSGPGVTLKHVLSSDKNQGDHAPKPPQSIDVPSPDVPLLEVKNLSFDYGDGNGFSDVSFKLMPGKLAVVSGELGSGKSTLLSVLMGLMPPDKGVVLIDGKPVGRGINRPVSVAGAPQRSGFFSVGIKENLCLGFPATENEMAQALTAAALGEMAADLSKGVERDLGSRGDRLSGGQQQRLALARMFIRRARLNVIDDCVSALDKDMCSELLGQLREFLRQTSGSAVIATNEPSFLEAADLVLFMENGRSEKV